MKKKVISMFLCVAMAGTLLTGCSGNSGNDTKESSTTESKTETKDAADKETKKSDDKKTEASADAVKYVSMWSDTEPQAKVIKEAADAFKEETGTEISIEFAGRQGVREGLQPRLDAGEDIDMFDEDIDRVIGQWGDYLMDLKDYVSGDYKGKAYREYINPSFDNIYKAVNELSGGGDAYKAIPYQPFIFDMVYNKTIFKEAGVEAVPATWDEFLAACQKIKDAGYTPLTVDNAYITCLLGYTIAAYTGSDEVKNIVTNNDWSNEAVKKAVQLWQDMYDKGYISEYAATNIYPNAQVTEFAPGEAAMYLNGTWLANEIKADVADSVEMGIFGFPKIEGAKNGAEAANFGSQVFAINKNSKKADKAFEFIAFVTTGEWDKKLSETTLGIPMDVENAWPKELEDAKALFPTLTTRYPWAASMDDNSDNQATILEKFTGVISGTLTADKFVEEMSK